MTTATLALDIRRIAMAEAHSKAGKPDLALRILLNRPCATCSLPVPPESPQDLRDAERGIPVMCRLCEEARGITA
jgi:hypothetical protein